MPDDTGKAKQDATVTGSGNITVQAVDSTVIVDGRPHLTLIPPSRRQPQTRTEIDLLNPYLRAIPPACVNGGFLLSRNGPQV